MFWTTTLAVAFCVGMACPAEPLRIYDAMTFTDKPSSEELGCTHFPGLYQWALHGGTETPSPKNYSKPDGHYYRKAARKAEDDGETIVWLNLEAWPCNLNLSAVETEKYLRNKLATLKIFQDEAPSVQWQVYNWTVDDQSIYWALAIDKVSAERWWKWQRFNQRYALPVLQVQSAIFPSCYLRLGYSDERYRRIEGSFIREIQQFAPGKPIYPFLRFRYTDKTWVLPERITMAVEYFRSLGVDGIVMWSPRSAKHRMPWDTPEVQAIWRAVLEAAGHATEPKGK